jgi:hypothetical protein
MTMEGISPGPEAEDLFGGWIEIAATVSRFVSQLPGFRGGSVVTDLLAALTDTQVGQAALLKSIKADTAALRKKPFKVALQSLEDARRVGPDHPSWDTFLRRAEDNFVEAGTLVSGSQEKAFVEFDLAIVYLAMGDEVNSRHHIEQSVQCADRAVNEYMQIGRGAITDGRPREEIPEFKMTATAGVFLAGAIGGMWVTGGALNWGYAKALTPQCRKACHELKGFLGFYNLIQRTASSVSGGAQPRYLTLDGPDRPLTRGLLSGWSDESDPYWLRVH